MITFDTKSPERGWDPFVQWMQAQGLDPSMTYRIDLIGEGIGIVYEWDLDADGRKYVIDNDVARRSPKQVALRSTPPLHPIRRSTRTA